MVENQDLMTKLAFTEARSAMSNAVELADSLNDPSEQVVVFNIATSISSVMLTSLKQQSVSNQLS